MSGDSSSSSNGSLLHPNLSSVNSNSFSMYCFLTRPSSTVYFTFFITSIVLLLPLCILILYLGFQRWRQQRSTTSTAVTSHSDIFTYHMVAMELIGILGYILCCCGIHRDLYNIFWLGYCFWYFTWYGQTFLHILTCVERYLAVVHPVTYLSLRGERGIRIRNISIGCVWLLSSGGVSLVVTGDLPLIMDFCLLIITGIIIFLCSLFVLCVLIRPGPGEQGGNRARVDQSKQRAFYTIVIILVVLLLRCVWNMVWIVRNVPAENTDCMSISHGVWFNLPVSLVLPLLFLHRAGTFTCCKST